MPLSGILRDIEKARTGFPARSVEAWRWHPDGPDRSGLRRKVRKPGA